ncbi:DUF4435 domain-containing protein [Tumebacillus sp. ITR2]|uniref:DUF4435 domain-containing protein n=1 Tax=Tumebacillus amylolyticus TaxID=2801339 RepID=A0ABS1J568_9BACL|nr:DUF4435 domain-containing protein [Tumebacillus amylolyticus]MBL0385428.1 DUF4435 domain-containing protein [Tumebacillus amylolyticus]
MTAYSKVFVEGKDDQAVLDQLFPIGGMFERAGNKRKALEKVEKDPTAVGLVDRDFDSDEVVKGSRVAECRCAILSRYSLENYFIEPKYLYKLAVFRDFDHLPNWKSEEEIECLILSKAKELCYLAAANEQLLIFQKNKAFHELTPFFDKPQLEAEAVKNELSKRMEQLPTRGDLDEVLKSWEQRSSEIIKECQTLQGVNRWINGKILLRKVIYQEICNIVHRYKEDHFMSDLVNIAKEEGPPSELVEILSGFGVDIRTITF